jgi:hypothetical protein
MNFEAIDIKQRKLEHELSLPKHRQNKFIIQRLRESIERHKKQLIIIKRNKRRERRVHGK